jgi:elongation factor Ts
MKITIQEINKLRQLTSAGLLDCKNALIEAKGNFDEAIDIIRKKGQKISLSRADRVAKEGRVFIKTSPSMDSSVMICLSSETDFVSQNEMFVALGQAIVDIALENKPNTLEDLLKLKIEHELSVHDKIIEMIGKTGEKIELINYEKVHGQVVITYVHTGHKLGVLLALQGINSDNQKALDDARFIAMQIAAMNPIAINREDIPKEILDKEFEIATAQCASLEKPKEVVEKIINSRVNTFIKENTLEEQAFVKETSMTVRQYINYIGKGIKVLDFKRVSI